MLKKLGIKSECESILLEFSKKNSLWKYLKSKRIFIKKISKNSFVDIYTGMSSKINFVNFQFSLHAGHSLVGKADPYENDNNWAVCWNGQRWIPEEFNFGRFTVYNHTDPQNKEFEELRTQGKKNYVRLEEFPERLKDIFDLAEAEIDRLFDTSSEENLITSVVGKPIGFFRPEEVLLIQLMLDNPSYYDELIEFYSQPIKTVASLTRNAINQPAADKLFQLYQEGKIPKFDFVG